MQATRGTTFGSECTASGLHAMVDSATFTNPLLADFISTEFPVYVGSTTAILNPVIGQLVYDNTANGSANPVGVMLAYNGNHYIPVNGLYVKNVSGSALNIGDVVIVSTSSPYDVTGDFVKVSKTTTAGNTKTVGVAAGSIADQATGYIVTRGPFYVNLNVGAIVGGAIKSSTTSGGADASSRLNTTGCFGRVLDATNKICLLTGLLKAT